MPEADPRGEARAWREPGEPRTLVGHENSAAVSTGPVEATFLLRSSPCADRGVGGGIHICVCATLCPRPDT